VSTVGHRRAPDTLRILAPIPGGHDVKISTAIVVGLSAFAPLFATGAALADADDVKWIGQCVTDNKDEGQTPEVVVSYCTCMNNKMSSSETRTVTQWEKTHKRELEVCAKQAGWVGK
jgi:hypothetical protein